jgi:hypothetical protein
MNNYIKIVIGHHTVTKEHIEKYDLTHKTTWLQAIKVTLYDMLFNHTIEIDGNYIVYCLLYKPHIGVVNALILSMYVKEEDRGNGKMSELIDKIPYDIVLGASYGTSSKYNNVANLSVFRSK